ncbi:MAG: ribonuclease R [Pelovirga sp.]
MTDLSERILVLLADGKKLDRRAMAEHLDLHGAKRKELTRVLKQLTVSGKLEQRRGHYRLNSNRRICEGNYHGTEQQYGFVSVAGREDIFIPAQYVGSALDGDKVQIEIRKSTRDRRPFGVITAIIERARSHIVGVLRSDDQGRLVVPQDRHAGPAVRVGQADSCQDGDLVEVLIEEYAEGGGTARGKIVERLGRLGDPHTDVISVLRRKKIPHDFSRAALAAVTRVPTQLEEQDLAGRTDLRQLQLVTIDGETARDFDDAVALQKQPDGNYCLRVCIADVAHYVAAGESIDEDARERGTSVYFPGFVVPMLPEALSNGICSLNPGEDRLVMAAEMIINTEGKTLSAAFYPAVMNSHGRFTYTQVAAYLEDGDDAEIKPEFRQQLETMDELAQLLTQMRYRRGSLNLDLPEVDIVVDDNGRPLELVKVERNIAHRLIEEFMLAANEAVARYLGGQGWPFLYRVHSEPDEAKLEELQQLAAGCGYGLVLGKDLHQSLQGLLEEVAERPEGRLISEQLLRSLQQAVYTPHNEGHFGLAAEEYCHFTSPIRRYPDLLVHRVLKQVLAGATKNTVPGTAQLESLGTECSARERRAMEAERDLADLRRCQLMEDRVGETFTGIISSVVDFGFFVELDDLLVEGLVHVRSLVGDYYHFDPTNLILTGENSRQQFRIGMTVEVKLERVDTVRRRIDFRPLDDAADGSSNNRKRSSRVSKKHPKRRRKK